MGLMYSSLIVHFMATLGHLEMSSSECVLPELPHSFLSLNIFGLGILDALFGGFTLIFSHLGGIHRLIAISIGIPACFFLVVCAQGCGCGSNCGVGSFNGNNLGYVGVNMISTSIWNARTLL